MLLIGLCGPSGSGKTTFCQLLLKHFKGAKEYTFASPLKETVAAAFSWPLALMNNVEKREKLSDFWTNKFGRPISPRIALQEIGTDVMREWQPDFWVWNLEQRLFQEDAEIVIVSDVRFINEAEFIKNRGGIIIKIVRPGLKKPAITANHLSETSLVNIEADFWVVNDKPFKFFESQDLDNIIINKKSAKNFTDVIQDAMFSWIDYQ